MTDDIKEVSMKELRIALPVTVKKNDSKEGILSEVNCPEEFLGLSDVIQATVFNGLFELVRTQISNLGGNIEARQEIPSLSEIELPMRVLASLRLTRAPKYQMEAEITFPDVYKQFSASQKVFLLTSIAKLYMSCAISIAGKG